MSILPEKPSMDRPSTDRPSTDEAEKELIRAGYCRLSDTNKKLITGETEALLFAQEEQNKQNKISRRN